MKIRKAKPNELEEIAKIMLKEFSKPPFNERVSFGFAFDSLKFYYNLGEIYVTIINREIAGILVFKIEKYWEGKVIIIEDLAVKEQFKKQEVEKALLNFVESYAKSRNIKRILFTTNKKSKAIKFYKKLGYKEEKNRINFSKKLK